MSAWLQNKLEKVWKSDQNTMFFLTSGHGLPTPLLIGRYNLCNMLHNTSTERCGHSFIRETNSNSAWLSQFAAQLVPPRHSFKLGGNHTCHALSIAGAGHLAENWRSLHQAPGSGNWHLQQGDVPVLQLAVLRSHCCWLPLLVGFYHLLSSCLLANSQIPALILLCNLWWWTPYSSVAIPPRYMQMQMQKYMQYIVHHISSYFIIFHHSSS